MQHRVAIGAHWYQFLQWIYSTFSVRKRKRLKMMDMNESAANLSVTFLETHFAHATGAPMQRQTRPSRLRLSLVARLQNLCRTTLQKLNMRTDICRFPFLHIHQNVARNVANAARYMKSFANLELFASTIRVFGAEDYVAGCVKKGARK